MKLAYEYGKIITLADFDVPVYDIQMEENMKEKLGETTVELKFPQYQSKKRKAKVEKKKKILKKGTTSYPIIKFVQDIMDMLDKHVETINDREYKPLCMPPNSSFLKPIEECWSKTKSNIKRALLDEDSILTPHSVQAYQTVTVDACLGWICHSKSYWNCCINKELGLKRKRMYLIQL
ncbi:uncharacterized protein BX663DRAFT_547089 [Cokeromyces recurvatus]|uniref:uncharacterized protein n=1 Tax=Cokeromyces recurvatus TaxID=90255 RepID=UPI00221EB738|nr:uncharacterized protein BX663DRAFT_547089 [Cokeromyces recurvatus]KAI7897580.1 hypothetical protein BX663DRAFT_547089 [Cokeromyces recurvatus]